MIRRAVPDDAAAINRVRVDSWQAAYGPLLPSHDWDEMRANARDTRLRTSITEGSLGVLVAEVDGVVRAYSFFGGCRDDDLPDAGEVFALYADPAHWSTGLGRALMPATLDVLAVRPVVLWVLEANVRARRFYERAGFAWDGSRKDAELPGEVLLPELRYRLDG